MRECGAFFFACACLILVLAGCSKDGEKGKQACINVAFAGRTETVTFAFPPNEQQKQKMQALISRMNDGDTAFVTIPDSPGTECRKYRIKGHDGKSELVAVPPGKGDEYTVVEPMDRD